jgi:hypothetical protein
MIAPALLETRHQVLHGQEVEVKVYAPGGVHRCYRQRSVNHSRCPICRPGGRDYDPDREGIRLKNIERRWPVALGIAEGFSESISGQADHEPSVCGYNPHPFNPLPKPKPKGCFVREINPPQLFADAVFANANQLARERLESKHAAAFPPWSPETRENHRLSSLDRARQRAAEDRDRKWQREHREAERLARERRIQQTLIPCQAGQCEMSPWTKLSRSQFRELLGRPRAEYETGKVRGCGKCPQIHVETRPHFDAL